MRYLSVTLSGLLLGAAAITATAGPTNPSTAPDSAMPNTMPPHTSMPPGATTRCPPGTAQPRTTAPGSATSHMPPGSPTPAPGGSTRMPPCR